MLIVVRLAMSACFSVELLNRDFLRRPCELGHYYHRHCEFMNDYYAVFKCVAIAY